MGIYGTDMIIDSTEPVVIPMICCTVQLMIPNDYKFTSLSIEMKLVVGDEEQVLFKVSPDSPPPQPFDPERWIKANVHARFPNFPLVQNSELRVRAYFDDAEIRLGAMPIRLKEISNTSAPTT